MKFAQTVTSNLSKVLCQEKWYPFFMTGCLDLVKINV